MEEVEQKLLHGNAAVVDSVVAKLFHTATSSTGGDSPELGVLWSHCKSRRPFVAHASASALAALAVADRLDNAATVSGLLALAPQAPCPEGVTSAVTKLSSRGSHGISYKAHPLISILRAYPAAWPHVLGQVRDALINTEQVDLLRPVIMFVMCDPHQHDHFAALRGCLLQTLLHHKGAAIDLLLWKILSWFTFNSAAAFYENAHHALRILAHIDLEADRLLPYLSSLTLKAVRLGVDPGFLLVEIRKHSVKCGVADLCVLLLTRALQISSTAHHQELMATLSPFLQEDILDRLSAGSLLAALLQTLPCKKAISQGVHNCLQKLMRLCGLQASDRLSKWEKLTSLTFVNDEDTVESLETLRVMWTVASDKSSGSSRRSSNLRPAFTCALATACANEDVSEETFDQLREFVLAAPHHFAYPVVAVAMFKVSSKQLVKPETKLHWLKLLPSLAKDKTCLAFVLQLLLTAIAGSPGLKALRLRLLFHLWRVEPRTYPHLKKALEADSESKSKEILLVLSQIVRDVCRIEARQHGADLLPVLSAILNSQRDEDASAICVFALQGIVALCRHQVIDLKTTYEVLKSKLWDEERRENVLTAFVELLALAPSFSLRSEQYDQFRKDLLKSLWRKLSTMESEQSFLRKHILQAIPLFPLEDHELIYMPEHCKKNLKYPSGFVLAPGTSAPDPVDVWQSVPGESWLQLVVARSEEESAKSDKGERDDYILLVSALMEKEISSLPRNAFYLSPAARSRGEEPASYDSLPETSILRAVASYMKTYQSGRLECKKSTVCALANLFFSCCEKKSLRLPPLDWRQFFSGDMKSEVFDISLIQYQHSLSAKRIVDSVVEGRDHHCFAYSVLTKLDYIAKEANKDELAAFLLTELMPRFQRGMANAILMKELCSSLKWAESSAADPLATAFLDLYTQVRRDDQLVHDLCQHVDKLPRFVLDSILELEDQVWTLTIL